MKKRSPSPLPELLAVNRNALTVYGALRWLSGERRQLSTTRRKVRDLCGLFEDTISRAMTALDRGGWVRVRYGRHGNRSWYRLTFPVPQFFPCTGKKTAQGEAREPLKKRHREPCPCTPEKRPPSLEGGGRVPPPPSPAPARAAAPAAPPAPEHQTPWGELLEDPGPDKRPIVDFLREKGLLRG